jgi:hypothetical protein
MEELLDAARAGALSPVVLVRGDRPLAEPAALRLAGALAEMWGTQPVLHRHPENLPDLIEDLRTYSLFSTGKVVIAVGTGVLADRAAAAEMLAEVRRELPWSGSAEELSGRAREAALGLLRVLRLFDLDPETGDAARLLSGLPDALFGSGRGRAGKATAEQSRSELEPLLAAALGAGLRGAGESEVSLLADLVRDGLPERHVLVLVESSVADSHPLVATLRRRDALVEAGRLATGRRGDVEGLDRLVAELERETGTRIRADAATELARRTLRAADARRGPAGAGMEEDSTERFAAEYRKLAGLSGDRAIDLEAVREHIEDRGEQDVWAVLDAVGAGRAGDALAALERRLAGADDRLAERLSFFALLAGFVRHVAAVGGLVRLAGVEAGVTSYPRFKERIAPRLQGEVAGVAKNPLAGVHPFRLHRAYLAAGKFSSGDLARLPALLLDTELRLKGESGEPEAALADLVVRLARPGGSAGEEVRSGRPGSAGSRRRGAGAGRS